MDQSTGLLLLIVIAALGIVATLAIMRRRSLAETAEPPESPYAASTEGMKRCPSCGVGNLVTESRCSNCGKRLPS
jgi:uncharacterized paraquat-inducible protein A